MSGSNKMKYVLNFVPSNESNTRGQWKCNKCEKIFPSWRDLKSHKVHVHSY